MSEHAELPWRVVPTVGIRNDAGFIVFLNNKPFHYTGQDERYEREVKEWEGDAEFIVRACNSHKDLQAACKMCFTACYRSTADFLSTDELAKLAAAIEKAKPK